MPVYNEAATVLAAIDDVLTAVLPVERCELIVIDDGSSDGTGDLLHLLSYQSTSVFTRILATSERAQPCGPVSVMRPATTQRCLTPISSTERLTSLIC